MPLHERVRQPQLAAKRAHLVLEQLAQRLDELELHALRQAADIVVRLDRDRRPAARRHALDHVRVQRALRQEIRAANLVRRLVEHLDEQPADGLALLLGIGHAGQLAEEARRGVHLDQRNVVRAAEQPLDLLGLALPQQPVIHEHAGELVADGLVQQHRDHRRIDAARQPANHLRRPDLLAQPRDLGVAEGGHRPVAAAARDLVHEILEHRRAAGRVHHFGVELHAVEPPLLVRDGRERRVARGGDGREALRQRRHAVAVAHPHRDFSGATALRAA